MQSTLTEPDTATWEQIAPLLEEAMGRLGEADRNAIVLRFFENKTAQEVASVLKLNEVTARKRVSRALEKLRGFFTHRGVVFPTAVLTTAISAHSVQAAPVALAKSVTAVAIVKGATASISTLTLIKGALKIMAWTKVKTAVATGTVLILVVGTTTLIVKNSGRHPQVKTQLNPATGESFHRESIVRLTQSKQWSLAFILFADKHLNQLPQHFDELNTYVPKEGLSDTNWEIVSGGNLGSFTNPSQTILLREKGSRQSPDGKFYKAYAFADGHAELVSFPSDDFTILEKQRGFLIHPATN